MKTTLFAALFLMSTLACAQTTTAPFKISTIAVHQPGNLPFRVYGMPTVPGCTANFAYVDEDDTTANAKISTLLTAFSAGKSIYLLVLPVTHPNDGKTYCQIRVVFLPQ